MRWLTEVRSFLRQWERLGLLVQHDSAERGKNNKKLFPGDPDNGFIAVLLQESGEIRAPAGLEKRGRCAERMLDGDSPPGWIFLDWIL